MRLQIERGKDKNSNRTVCATDEINDVAEPYLHFSLRDVVVGPKDKMTKKIQVTVHTAKLPQFTFFSNKSAEEVEKKV